MKLKFPWAVEAVVFFTCACSYSMDTVQYEFIYQAISQRLNHTSNNSVDYCTSNQSQSDMDHNVADQTSRWTMYTTLCSYIPCVVGALVLISWSDYIGRKKAIVFPVVGTLIGSTFQMVIILYRFPLYSLIIGEVLYGAFGAYSALMSIGSAYLSDTVETEDRGRRFTILEVSASVGGGAIQIATGYWINSSGFIPPSIFIIACAFVALLFIPLMQSGERPTKKKENDFEDMQRKPLLARKELDERRYGTDICTETSKTNGATTTNKTLWDQLMIVWKLYTTEPECDEEYKPGPSQDISCRQPHGRRRTWRLWFYVLSFSIYMFAVNGVEVFRTMFLVSYPVCFSPGLVGAQAGLGNGLIIAAPFVIKVFQNCMRFSGHTIILIGIATRIASCLIMSVARSPSLVFLATSMGIFYSFTTAFMRSEASKLASPNDQGAVLSVLSGFESFLNIFSPVTFLFLYPATLYIFRGFSYVVSALIYCLPLIMMLTVWIANKVADFQRTKGEFGRFNNTRNEG